MLITPLAIADVRFIEPKRFSDERGYFSETYRRDRLVEAGIDVEFVQDNESLSVTAGTIRGLHFQAPPHAQAKLVRAVRGEIFDVAVDIRSGSPTFGRYVSAVLTGDAGEQLYVPAGFAHGFCTLVENTVVAYKVTDYYAHDHEFGLLWNDPDLAIEWPVAFEKAVLSARDEKHPRLREMTSPFNWQ